MPRVTAVRETRRGVVVELDERAWRTLPVDVVVRAGLTVGAELDRPLARTLRRELRRHDALARAGRALRRRDHTVRELDSRLAHAGFAGGERTAALSTLERAGLVDDRRFAAGRAGALAERGWGDAAIAWKLEQAGVAAERTAEAVAALEPEVDRARRLVARRGGRAAAAWLARRGFSEESVDAVVGTRDAGPID